MISKVCMFVVFSKMTICIDVLFILYVTNYSCKYHEILGYNHDMYVMKYVGILRIYISQVSMRSAENRYIYKVQYIGVLRVYIYIYIYIYIRYTKHAVFYMFLALQKV